MFSSARRLQQRTPPAAARRPDYLARLAAEFLQARPDAKQQVLANLANFAYDPINYEYIRSEGVLDIFLDVIKQETDETLLHFASAGICNLCLDALNADYIIQYEGLQPIINLLRSTHTETLTSIITILIYLYTAQTRSVIVTDNVVQTIRKLHKSEDKRLTNLVTIFLTDIADIKDVL